MNFVADFDINGFIDFVWVFENLKKIDTYGKKWKVKEKNGK